MEAWAPDAVVIRHGASGAPQRARAGCGAVSSKPEDDGHTQASDRRPCPRRVTMRRKVGRLDGSAWTIVGGGKCLTQASSQVQRVCAAEHARRVGQDGSHADAAPGRGRRLALIGRLRQWMPRCKWPDDRGCDAAGPEERYESRYFPNGARVQPPVRLDAAGWR